MKLKHVYTLFLFSCFFGYMNNYYICNASKDFNTGLNRTTSVYIEDENLLKTLNECLGRTDENAYLPISESDMLKITSIDGLAGEVSSFEGLQYAKNLTYFYTEGNVNKTISLEPFRNLTKLDTLYLIGVKFESLEPIKNLTQLTTLRLEDCGLNDSFKLNEYLKNLINIEVLGLAWNNDIEDISFVSNYSKLTKLRIEGNKIKDISCLKGKNLTEDIRISDNLISDITPLANSNITYLEAYDNRIQSNFNIFNTMPKLYGIDLSSNGITDISSFLENNTITELDLCENTISDLSPLSRLKNLECLELEHAEYTNMDTLPYIESLDVLKLSNNYSLSNISTLGKKVPNLTRLHLSDISVKDFSSLAPLTKLEYLDICINDLHDKHLDTLPLTLTNLKELCVNYNNLEDPQHLNNFKSLTILNIGSNSLSNLNCINKLTNLTNLIADWNYINDISDIVNLKELGYLNLGVNELYSDDIIYLSNLINLYYLELGTNYIDNIEPLSNLTNLSQFLGLDKNKISDISPLSALVNLTEIDLRDNLVSDLIPLKPLSSLEKIKLDRNHIIDVTSLEHLDSLEFASLLNQTGELDLKYAYNTTYKLKNPLQNSSGEELLSPDKISNNGSYSDEYIIWNRLEYPNTYSFTVEYDGVVNVRTAERPLDAKYSCLLIIPIKTIDIDGPEFNYNLSPSNWTSNNVTISIESFDVFSGVKKIILPNKNSIFSNKASYTVLDNGIYSFIFVDNADNISIAKIKVTNIDRNTPSVTIHKSIEADWSNADIFTTIEAHD